ncbi:MAG: PRC-barrel domain-containing protein [Candidatus Rokubacteria bacterium]|nr:PRC-barrel domain-containing protein [Candidatus Rokubacteria bacterium]
MLRSVSDLQHVTITAMDGSLGSMSDLYFDDRSWAVRYLVVEAGTWLPSGRVFVPPASVRSADSSTLRVALSKKQVNVSSMVNTGDAHLQPATAVMGCAMQAEDGEIGHVKDVLVDDKAWAIRYLVVDTEKWWAGKKVLVSPGWLTRVTWGEPKTLFCLVTSADDTAAPRTLSRSLAG